jgi:EmrB/QacA subfamily drug resistance transporter
MAHNLAMADAGLRLNTAPGRWVLTAAVLGSGVVSLDATVVNIALPTIGKDLHADVAGLTWTVNGYSLTLAPLILLGGALGDRYGRRRIFVLGVVWFGLASLLCGIAPNLTVLILARTLQGIGGALLTPGSLAMISASFAPDDRGRAIGAWSGLGGLAGAAGPLVAGLLLDLSWRLVFLINIPLAAFVAALAIRHVPETLDDQAPRHLDVAGSAAGVIGLTGVTYALAEAPGRGAGSPLVLGAAVMGILGMAAFLIIEARGRNPLIPLDIFASRQFTAANLVTFALYAALGGIFLLLALVLQISVGMSPLAAGSALLPITAIMLMLSSKAGEVAARIGPRRPMTFGPLVVVLALFLMLGIRPGSSYWTGVLPSVIVFGIGLSIFVAPLTSAVLAAAETRHAGVASGVNNAVARTAGLLAVAVLPAVTGLSGAAYQDPNLMARGFHIAVWCCIGLVVVSAVIAWFGISDEEHAAAEARPAITPAEAAVAPAEPADLQAAERPAITIRMQPIKQPYHCAVCVPPPPIEVRAQVK